MKKYLFFIIAIVLPVMYSQAQPTTSTGFSIGDTVPPLNIPIKETADLVILDFWATWCNSCLHEFPKLDSLQRMIGQSLQIILINKLQLSGDSFVEVDAFVARYRMQHPFFALPLIASMDTVLLYGFPGRILPHYVWLNRDRIVIGITGAAAVTVENIQRALCGDYAHLPLKTDFIDYAH